MWRMYSDNHNAETSVCNKGPGFLIYVGTGGFEVEEHHLHNAFIKKVIMPFSWKFIIQGLSQGELRTPALLTQTLQRPSTLLNEDKAHVFP